MFKGKGFYATDNRSPSGQNYSSEKENGSKKETESKSEDKPDKKKTETKSKEE